MTLMGGACSGTQSRGKVITEKKVPVVKIGNLKKNPSLYLGKTVTVKGEYRGWKAECGPPPVTRSDWGVRDETGTIYVTGKPASHLDPYKDIGRKITVTGTFHLKKNPYAHLKIENIPYIKAVKIEIGK